MSQIYARKAVAYKCDTCNRSVRLVENVFGIEIIQRCTITYGCQGKLRRLLTQKETIEAPTLPPDVANLQNWFQRPALFTFIQTIQSSTWQVVHNLGAKPTVQVQVYRGNELTDIIPKEIKIIDLNTIELVFDKGETGIVQCINVTSTNKSINEENLLTDQPLQLTNHGVLTIATQSTLPLISLTGVFGNQATEIHYVAIPSVAAILSPWAGVNRVFINGKTYTVRSFDIVESPLAPNTFSANLVNNGDSLYFKEPINTNEYLLLLGKAPFGITDRVYDKFIDLALINKLQPELFYNQGELYTMSSVIKETYPLIFIVD